MAARNPYDVPDPFEICDRTDAEDEHPGAGRGLVPASASLPALPAARVPDVTEYARELPVSWSDRRLARRQLQGLELSTELQRRTKDHIEAFDAKEEAKRKAITNQTRFVTELPHAIEKHKQECKAQVVEACRIYAKAVDLYHQERIDRVRIAAVRERQFRNQLLRLETEEEELLSGLARAGELGARVADARVAEAEVRVARNLAAAGEHRAKEEGYRAKHNEKRGGESGFSRTMREHLARSEVIGGDRRATQARIDAVYLRAAREGRRLEDHEVEEVDRLRDSLKASEREHRTTAASDLGFEDED